MVTIRPNENKLEMDKHIRTDCYVSVYDKFKAENPDAHFEVITRKTIPAIGHTKPSVLSPTWPLLDKIKKEKWDMPRYYAELGKQIMKDPDAIYRLEVLACMVRQGKTVFLVCYEKDAAKCHRTYIKALLSLTARFPRRIKGTCGSCGKEYMLLNTSPICDDCAASGLLNKHNRS
jgi:hypothetical protein